MLLLGVSSCGADGSTYQDTTEISADESSADSTGNSPINTTSSFIATLVSGATFDSAKVLETQPIALWFWAPG